MVVSLPGLEVFPGDLLVSDSAMDCVPHATLLLSAGQIRGGVCSSENACACGMGREDQCNNFTQSSTASVGDAVSPDQRDCIANLKIPLSLFFLPECCC